MGKMNELSATIDEMIACGNGLVKAAEALKAFYSSENGTAQEGKPAEPLKKEDPEPPTAEKSISKEDVRKLLVAKSNADGGAYKPAVKELVKKYSGTGQLSSIPTEKYADVVAELEGIGNA